MSFHIKGKGTSLNVRQAAQTYWPSCSSACFFLHGFFYHQKQLHRGVHNHLHEGRQAVMGQQ